MEHGQNRLGSQGLNANSRPTDEDRKPIRRIIRKVSNSKNCTNREHQKFESTEKINIPRTDQGKALQTDSRFVQIALTFQFIMRNFARVLSPSQLAVLLFVMDRTVGWGKRWEVITHRHFLKGIPARDENLPDYAGGLKMSLNTLKHALRCLIGHGFIIEQKQEGRNGILTAYALNSRFFPDLPDDEQEQGKGSNA